MKQIFLQIISLLISLTCFANEFKFANVPPSGNEEAVLVLAPGMNMDGAFFLDEKPWTDFAKEHKLGVIALNYSSDVDGLYGSKKQGYYWPEQGSGKALLDEINRVYGKNLPVLIFGFSGGAQFASRFIDFAPDQIVAWCAYSAQFWDALKSIEQGGCKARGIVACGDLDGTRWQSSFGFYYQGRLQGKDWIWLSRKNTEHNRSAGLEQFVRDFFAEELAIYRKEKNSENTDIVADISTMEIVKNEESEIQPALACPFRTKELYESWKKIHTP